jgi:hypothetical protein
VIQHAIYFGWGFIVVINPSFVDFGGRNFQEIQFFAAAMDVFFVDFG